MDDYPVVAHPVILLIQFFRGNDDHVGGQVDLEPSRQAVADEDIFFLMVQGNDELIYPVWISTDTDAGIDLHFLQDSASAALLCFVLLLSQLPQPGNKILPDNGSLRLAEWFV